MAAKYSLLLLRRLSRPYASIQKSLVLASSRPYASIQKSLVLASSQSSLFHTSTEPMRSIPKPEWVPLGGLQKISVPGLLKTGSTARNCRNPMDDDDPDNYDHDDDEDSEGLDDDHVEESDLDESSDDASDNE